MPALENPWSSMAFKADLDHGVPQHTRATERPGAFCQATPRFPSRKQPAQNGETGTVLSAAWLQSRSQSTGSARWSFVSPLEKSVLTRNKEQRRPRVTFSCIVDILSLSFTAAFPTNKNDTCSILSRNHRTSAERCSGTFHVPLHRDLCRTAPPVLGDTGL